MEPTLAAAANTRLANILKQTELFGDEQIAQLLAPKPENGPTLTRRVVEEGLASEEAFLSAISRILTLPYQRLNDAAVSAEALQSLPAKVVFQYNVVPLSAAKGI